MTDELPTEWGPYTLLQRLGTGGVAEVFLAQRHNSLHYNNTSLVIKRLLRAHCDYTDLQQQLCAEAELAQRFTHPHIVQTIGLQRVAHEPVIEMASIHGINSGIDNGITIIDAQRALALHAFSVEQAVTVTLAIAKALDAIHHHPTHACTHGDISPENIVLSADLQHIQLIDFGAARLYSETDITNQPTHSFRRPGKYKYMSPEEARDEPRTFQSDMFSLGLVFYELLTGTPAYRATNLYAIIHQAQQAVIVPPFARHPRLAPDVSSTIVSSTVIDQLVMKALHPKPAQRYSSAKALIQALCEAGQSLAF